MSATTDTSETRRVSPTAGLAALIANDWRPPSEYLDCKGVEAVFGIKPGLAYDLLASGDINGVSLKRRGQTRGKRLFKVESIRAFLNKQAEVNAAKGAEVLS